jgi:ATP-dependent Clp protease ATP-binding subunit ClpA
MSALTPGARLAWKIAAAEAADARFPKIDKPHLLLGLLSLGKALAAAEDLPDAERKELSGESRQLEELLARLALQAVTLRRAVRQRVGVGTHRHAPGAAISRTEAVKSAFSRAEELAGGEAVSCLHLLVALFERPDPHLDLLLREAQLRPEEIEREALLRLLLVRLAARAAVEGARLVFDARAEALLSTQGDPRASRGSDIRRVVAELVEAPLAELIRSGKLGKHEHWRVAEEEGAIYIIPDE